MRLITGNSTKERGQSLVEMAITAPILIIILVGLIEVAQLAVTQNKISTAARTAARFAANGGEDAGIRLVALRTVTQTLDLNSGVWDIWSIRATVGVTGSIPTDEFDFEHIYGAGQTEDYSLTNNPGFTDKLRQMIEDDLKKDGKEISVDDLGAGLEIVGVYILHDIESILGLNIMPNLLGFETITGYSVMRRASLADSIVQTSGCKGVFPFALEQSASSISKSEYISLTFSYPTPKPSWDSFSRQPGSPTPLLSASEGNIFKLNLGNGPDSFNWLKWNTTINGINPPPAGASILAASLYWPGNSGDYVDRGDSPEAGTFRGFAEVEDPDDHQLHVGDLVAQDSISGGIGGAGVAGVLQEHINNKRTLRVVLWDNSEGGFVTSPTNSYRVDGFAIVRIRGYGPDWLLVELFRLDNSCGQSVIYF